MRNAHTDDDTTMGQVANLLTMLSQKGIDKKGLVQLQRSGLLSDLLDVDPTWYEKIIRGQFRQLIGLDPVTFELAVKYLADSDYTFKRTWDERLTSRMLVGYWKEPTVRPVEQRVRMHLCKPSSWFFSDEKSPEEAIHGQGWHPATYADLIAVARQRPELIEANHSIYSTGTRWLNTDGEGSCDHLVPVLSRTKNWDDVPDGVLIMDRESLSGISDNWLYLAVEYL